MLLEGTMVAATVMTSKVAADAIYKESQKHVPYRDGILYDSAGDGPFLVEGSSLGMSDKISAVSHQVEGSLGHAAALVVS
jgi:hypothetical protein